MEVSKISVETTGESYIFEGEDAKNVYNAIYNAGMTGAEWTTPTELSSGMTIVFVLQNIVYFEFK